MSMNLYFFDEPPAVSRTERRALLGGKGAGLAAMTCELGMPVPYGFTIPTTVGRDCIGEALPEELTRTVRTAVLRIEQRLGRRFGDPSNPLFLSVRSGAAESMPGMMDTILNVGATPRTIAALAERSGEAFALNSYARFLRMYGGIVAGLTPDDLATDATLPPASTVERLRGVYGARGLLPTIDDCWQQLFLSIAAVFRSWHSERAVLYRRHQGLAGDAGTAATIQAMVFGNQDEHSGTGVYFTRDPSTGEALPYGDYLPCAQGEDVVAGTHRTQHIGTLADRHPALFAQLVAAGETLETHYRDACDIEFTIESGTLWLLQVRPAKRSAAAAIRIALDLAEDSAIALSAQELLARVTRGIVETAAASLQEAGGTQAPIATGLGASPGTATGRAYFSADDAADAADRGEDVIFIARETSPSDLHGFEAAKGILTTTGGLVSHASLVAREWGIPAVVGASDIVLEDKALRAGAARIAEGEQLSVDGKSGAIYAGAITTIDAATEPALLQRLRAWLARRVAAPAQASLIELLAAAAAHLDQTEQHP